MGFSVSDAASVISAIAAATAAYFSFKVVRETQASGREQQAFEFVRKYLELAIQFPKLSTEGGKHTEQQRYEWFVSFTLMMTQSVRAFPEDIAWRKLMRQQLEFNSEELAGWKVDDPKHFGLYGPDVERLVDEALRAAK